MLNIATVTVHDTSSLGRLEDLHDIRQISLEVRFFRALRTCMATGGLQYGCKGATNANVFFLQCPS